MIKIYNLSELTDEEILYRRDEALDVSAPVRDIIENVRKSGDRALKEYTAKFDKVELSSLRVSEEEITEAFEEAGERFIGILERAAANIREFHEKQVRTSFIINKENGVVMGQKVMPLEKVGIYVPGGLAAYPSTVLMTAIPAKIAGCKRIVMTTPPMKNGKVNPNILAAAKIAGVTDIYKVGGAQAVAALANGTETIPQVDKIVGPGNAYVAEAKRQVYGRVAIDMIAGPSEILIISDGKSNPTVVAADLLSQAEHDKMASAVLITNSKELADKVQAELEKQLAVLPREEIARTSIEKNGKIIVTKDITEAIRVSDRLAPEHLELCLDNPFDYLGLIHNAGSIFMGRNCPEALGDYMAGPNHTLPTSGTARFSSPLSVDDYVKKTQYTYFTKDALSELAEDVYFFAEKEGLSAHARSAVVRLKEEV